MTMSLVNGRISGEEVKVFITLHIPHMDTLSSTQRHWHRFIVVAAEFLLSIEDLLGGQSLGR